MPWAALLLTAGFCMREVGAFHDSNVSYLISSTSLIMSGPPIYALINYMILSRLLFYIPYCSRIHPGRILTTFLAADGLLEILIINGVRRMVDPLLSHTEQEIGAILVKVSLIAQLCLFLVFNYLAFSFQSRASSIGVLKKEIRNVLIVMYISSSIIMARCIYRISEFFEGFYGEVYTHEVYFWLFEATIMFINTFMLNIWHPGKRLPRSNKVFLSRDGKMELRGPGWKIERNFFITLIDPFDLWGLFTGKDAKTKFWELTPEQLDEMAEEDRRKREEELAAPRAAWKIFLDPLRLFGPNGRIKMLGEWMDGEDDLKPNVVRVEELVGRHTTDSKNA
jgi:hypothetical protein